MICQCLLQLLQMTQLQIAVELMVVVSMVRLFQTIGKAKLLLLKQRTKTEYKSRSTRSSIF